MLQKLGWLMALVIVVALAPATVVAQDADEVVDGDPPPAVIREAVEDLAARLNVSLTLNDIFQWTWVGRVYEDASLGCPQPGQTYAQVRTRGFRFLLTYRGTTYDYRVSATGDIVILCNQYPAGTAPNLGVTVETAPIAVADTTATVSGAQAVVAPTGIGAAGANCALALTPRLEPDGFAQMVLAETPLNVRAEPALTSRVVERIQPGEVVRVLAGPSCGPNNIAWWQVDLGAESGWAAEGRGTIYFLEPVEGPADLVVDAETDLAPLAADIPCPGGLPTRLSVGELAAARPNLTAPLNVRTEPTITSPVIDQIPRGEIVPVVDGPQCGPQGLTWWLVQTEDVTGWAAEASGGVYLLEPVG